MRQDKNIYTGFGHTKYLIKRKVFTFKGRDKCTIYDLNNNEIFYCEKQLHQIDVYTDKNKQEKVLIIQPDQAKIKKILGITILDMENVIFNIIDSKTNFKIGAVQKDWSASLMSDNKWHIMDKNNNKIGLAQDEKVVSKVLGFLSVYTPTGKFILSIGDKTVAIFQETSNFFNITISLDFSPDSENLLDRRTGIAVVILKQFFYPKGNRRM